MSNEKFICLKIKNKIVIYSIGLEIPIVDVDIDHGIDFILFANQKL